MQRTDTWINVFPLKYCCSRMCQEPFIVPENSQSALSTFYIMSIAGLSAGPLCYALAWLRQVQSATYMAGFAGSIAVLLLVDMLRAWYRLSHVPGPFLASLSKYWLVSHSLKGNQPYAIQAANQKYGESYLPRGIELGHPRGLNKTNYRLACAHRT